MNGRLYGAWLGGLAALAGGAAAPATADELGELKAQVQALQRRIDEMEAAKTYDLPPPQRSGKPAEGPPVATIGSFPGSMVIPGTNTSLKIGGYAKMDLYYDFAVKGNADAQDATSVPVGGSAAHQRQGYGHMEAKYSRFNIDARTPTDYGEFQVFTELDFGGSTSDTNLNISKNGYAPRLRYAYGKLGPFLAGQYNSVFRDIPTEYESLDSGYPTGINDNRTPQLRYTHPLWSDKATLAVALENPETDYSNQAGASQNGTNGGATLNRLPDLVAALGDDPEWGHWSLRGVVRELRLKDGVGTHADQVGWGVGASLAVKTFGKDKVLGQFNYGNGIGRYITDAAATSMVVNSASNVDVLNAWGANLGYQHWWMDALRSNMDVGFTHIDRSDLLTAAGANNFNHNLMTAAFNIMWSPIPRIDTGLEYLFARRVTQGGDQGNQHRLLYSVIWKF